MTNVLITDIENIPTEIKAWFTNNPAVQTIETDAVAIGTSALNFIKTNGLTDLYNLALAVLTGAATGTPWATIGATVVTQGEAAGISIAKGAEAVVIAQAQADLVAAGTIVSPTSGATVTSAPIAAPTTTVPATPAA